MSAYLAFVDMVIGVDRILAPELASEDLDGSVTNHLVDVHVSLSPRSGLPHHQREVVVQFASNDLKQRAYKDLTIETYSTS